MSVDVPSARVADLHPGEFPFRCQFGLGRLIAWWEREAAAGRPLAQWVVERLAQAPALRAPVLDRATLERHRDLVDLLMTAVFPAARGEQVVGAALPPFTFEPYWVTPAMRRLGGEPGAVLGGRVNLDPRTGLAYRVLHAYGAVLRTHYGIHVPLDYPLVVTIQDPETGEERHLKTHFDPAFVEIAVEGPLPPLDEAARRRLLANLSDPRALAEILPPAPFVFRGFTVFSAVEVTDHQIISALQRDLIERESIVSPASFHRLEERLRAFLRRPGLALGLAAIEGDRVLLLSHHSELEHGCIFADSTHLAKCDFAGSVYERAATQPGALVIEDLAAWPGRTAIEERLLEAGVRSLLLAALRYQDQVIGLLELSSEQPGDFNAIHAFRLSEVLPLFAMAVKRSMDELDTRIQAVIKEQFTAIHPSVEWRFRRAVLDMIERQRAGESEVELPPIVFEGVYPLYGLVDVRGSSTHRARAVQADLLAQLRLAREAVAAAHRARALPALDELGWRLDRQAARVEAALSTGDEQAVIAFLRAEVEPLLDHLAGFDDATRARVAAYRAAVDPRLRAVYRERRRFEESLTRLTDALSGYLDLEEQVAQSMFPHYFEKQKTDGVDYQIYVGAALVEDGRFTPLYLRNLRLWQLMVTCGLAVRAERLKASLPLPLETTHLVLVQHAPLAIRFRFDEKRFDVDGAYNARYEIVKKRIDKAVVRGSGERLTQPGHIAIVYGHPAEAAEYRGYLEYLQSLGYLAPGIEDVELDDLQGVQGLRALRVAVDLANPRLEEPTPARDALASA